MWAAFAKGRALYDTGCSDDDSPCCVVIVVCPHCELEHLVMFSRQGRELGGLLRCPKPRMREAGRRPITAADDTELHVSSHTTDRRAERSPPRVVLPHLARGLPPIEVNANACNFPATGSFPSGWLSQRLAEPQVPYNAPLPLLHAQPAQARQFALSGMVLRSHGMPCITITHRRRLQKTRAYKMS